MKASNAQTIANRTIVVATGTFPRAERDKEVARSGSERGLVVAVMGGADPVVRHGGCRIGATARRASRDGVFLPFEVIPRFPDLCGSNPSGPVMREPGVPSFRDPRPRPNDVDS